MTVIEISQADQEQCSVNCGRFPGNGLLFCQKSFSWTLEDGWAGTIHWLMKENIAKEISKIRPQTGESLVVFNGARHCINY